MYELPKTKMQIRRSLGPKIPISKSQITKKSQSPKPNEEARNLKFWSFLPAGRQGDLFEA
jgi:hypothetical protein